AGERKQFKKTIDKFPAMYDMLTRMKTKIVATRALLYETTRAVDLRYVYTQLVEHKADVTVEERQKAKYWTRIAAVLTPMCKAQSTEVANQVAYDAIQIHGGTGFMKDFPVERFYRDARITNIYEGTTQLQVVAAIGGVMQRHNDVRIKELMALPFEGMLARLKDKIAALYEKQLEAIKYVAEKKDAEYQSLVAQCLVDMETMVFIGMLMLRDALKDSEREVLAERYILDSESQFEERFTRVTSGDLTTIDKHREIIDY
ncbi:MAG: hypothetical protein KAS17_08025, partial [Victivallaceae bacterium]|nr:hypothetical protein [Victivallaceae bacterium]